MKVEEKREFCEECTKYLASLSLNDLRAYGRFLGVSTPTCLKKAQLIEEILQALIGEKKCERTKRGAPIKNDYFPKEILSVVEKIREKYFGKQLKLEENSLQKREESAVVLQFSVNFEQLNAKQKKLLNAFLNSL